MKTEHTIKNLGISAILNIIKKCCNIIFPLITFPYVSRILGSSNFGKYSFSDSVVSYFMLFAALGVPTYAVREGARIREDRDTLIQFSSEIFSINLISLVISYVFFVYAAIFMRRSGQDVLLIYILSVNIITSVLGRDWINSIYEDFLFITVRYVIFQTLAVLLIFLLVRRRNDYVIYTIIMLFSNSGAYISNIIYTRKYIPIRITYHFNLRKHLKPIVNLFCISIALTVYIHSDVTILGFLRSEEEVGVYTLSSKVYTIVKALLNAVIMVAIPRLSNYLGRNDTDAYNTLLYKLKIALAMLVFPCVTGLFCMSSEVMWLIGGSEYLYGGRTLSILCLALVFAVFSCYYAQGILVPNRKENKFFIATIISATVNIILNLITISSHGMAAAAVTTVMAELIVMLLCRHYSRPLYKKRKDADKASVFMGCISIVMVCGISKLVIPNIILRSMVGIFISIILYFFILILMKNSILLDILKKSMIINK